MNAALGYGMTFVPAGGGGLPFYLCWLCGTARTQAWACSCVEKHFARLRATYPGDWSREECAARENALTPATVVKGKVVLKPAAGPVAAVVVQVSEKIGQLKPAAEGAEAGWLF